VDVGGGHGHQSVLLGQKYPNLLGRLVLQDLPSVVKGLRIEGVSIQPYNFFERQPVHGKYFWVYSSFCRKDPTDISFRCKVLLSSPYHARLARSRCHEDPSEYCGSHVIRFTHSH